MEWISIKDKMPNKDKLVLFTCLTMKDRWTDPQCGRYKGGKTEGEAIPMDCDMDDDWFPCTHWIELPSHPKTT